MNEKEFIATTLKSAQKALEHTATTSAKIAVKRAMKKNSNHDRQSEEFPSQVAGPTMADAWLRTLENSAKNAVSPIESLQAIEQMIGLEKNKLIENKKKEIVFKSIIDNASHHSRVTTLFG